MHMKEIDRSTTRGHHEAEDKHSLDLVWCTCESFSLYHLLHVSANKGSDKTTNAESKYCCAKDSSVDITQCLLQFERVSILIYRCTYIFPSDIFCFATKPIGKLTIAAHIAPDETTNKVTNKYAEQITFGYPFGCSFYVAVSKCKWAFVCPFYHQFLAPYRIFIISNACCKIMLSSLIMYFFLFVLIVAFAVSIVGTN